MQADKLTDDFVSTVSHELRTPLTAMAAALALLKQGACGELPPPAARLVAIANSNGERLVRLVNDILDLEKIGSRNGIFHIQRVELYSVLENVIEAERVLAAQSNVRLRLVAETLTAEVNADADRLAQVVANLLSNAIKFSPPGEEIVIVISASADKARVTVRDYGPGIPEDFKPRVFERFAQARGERRRDGSGLGLSIVREIVRRLGGEVGFDSAVGHGTLFWFELPLYGEALDGGEVPARSVA